MMYPPRLGGERSKTPTKPTRDVRRSKSKAKNSVKKDMGQIQKLIENLDTAIEDKIAKLEEIRDGLVVEQTSRSQKKSLRSSKSPSKAIPRPDMNHGNPKLLKKVKEQVFREVENKLFETRIDNSKLSSFLTRNKTKHASFFSYDYIADKNLSNLKFCIYLLVEEVTSLIANLGYPEFKNSPNLEEKINKRNKIIDYLLKEKIATSAIFAKVMSAFENTNIEITDISRAMASTMILTRLG